VEFGLSKTSGILDGKMLYSELYLRKKVKIYFEESFVSIGGGWGHYISDGKIMQILVS